jgi:uncharacterized protein (TIGR00369 family)
MPCRAAIPRITTTANDMRPENPDQLALHRYLADPSQVPGFTANPMASALGARLLSLDGESGAIGLEFAPEGIFVQGAGVLQGGAVTAMLDFAMAFALLAVLPAGHSCATGINVSFLRAAPHGRYVASGSIDRRGKRLAFTRAALAPAGAPAQVVARATSTLAILD